MNIIEPQVEGFEKLVSQDGSKFLQNRIRVKLNPAEDVEESGYTRKCRIVIYRSRCKMILVAFPPNPAAFTMMRLMLLEVGLAEL